MQIVLRFLLQDIEEIIKSWTPKPIVNTNLITESALENYVLESKVKFRHNYSLVFIVMYSTETYDK